MSNIVAVHPEEHSRYTWMSPDSYAFAIKDTSVPLLALEFANAASVAPIAFTKKENGFHAILLMSLNNEDNLLLTDSGRWRGNYIPAYYRAHPFCIARDKLGNAKLSFFDNSPHIRKQIVPGANSAPFFIGNDLSPELQEMRTFLQQLERGRQLSEIFFKKCSDLDLFTPWPIMTEINQKKISLSGLYQINEEKLKRLSGDVLKGLAESDQLAPLYHHLSSRHLIGKLTKIANFKRVDVVSAVAEPEELLKIDNQHDSINFDW